MSRALDADTAASIDYGAPERVYNDLVEALCQDKSELLEIEFLGKSHPLPAGCNVLVDGNSIAIPKVKLLQAFIFARKLFFKSRDGINHGDPQTIRNATAIILLMDPEHLTAANARKRLIQASQQKSNSNLEVELRRELQWLDSMLTARLKRHTKSPTLWDHRRWVLSVWKSIPVPRDVHRDLTTVILVSAERHPRNYYAWLHMRWLFNNFLEAKSMEEATSNILSTVSGWCLRNPADTAGFSSLLFCLSQLPKGDARINAGTNVCKEVLGLAGSFKWTHESIWVFLRTLVASGQVLEEQKSNFFNTIEKVIASQPGSHNTLLILHTARDWCIEYGIK